MDVGEGRSWELGLAAADGGVGREKGASAWVLVFVLVAVMLVRGSVVE